MTTGHPDRTRPPPADSIGPPHGDEHEQDIVLRAERVRVAHWRRLVRARTDLAAAALALPDPLGQLGSSSLATVAPDPPPSYLVLLDAVSTGGPCGEIERLEALRDLDDRLAGYELALARAQRAADAPDQARWGRLSA